MVCARATVRGRLNSVASAFQRLRKTNSDRTLVDVGINHLKERTRQFILKPFRICIGRQMRYFDSYVYDFWFRSRWNKNACFNQCKQLKNRRRMTSISSKQNFLQLIFVWWSRFIIDWNMYHTFFGFLYLFHGSYSERAKNVSAYFCHSILVFCLISNKDRMTKTRVNIFRSVFWIRTYTYK